MCADSTWMTGMRMDDVELQGTLMWGILHQSIVGIGCRDGVTDYRDAGITCQAEGF